MVRVITVNLTLSKNLVFRFLRFTSYKNGTIHDELNFINFYHNNLEMISNTLPQVTRWVPNLSIFGSWVISRKMENQSFFQFSSDLKFLLSVTWLNNELRLWSQEDDNHEKTCITFRKVKCIPSFVSIIYTVYDDKTIS